MPKNKKQDVVFTLLMAAAMVYGMICYNVTLNIGGMRNEVFLAAFHEFPIMWPVAVLLELIFVGRLAQKLAFRLVDPRTAPPAAIMLAISAMSVWLMCPCMSFFACLFFKGGLLQSEFIAIWVQTTVLNFPMALLLQFFAAGPLVRLIFRHIFHD
ncbi:DUF2798 domain-containing protein [Agathobaculum sp. Marseille-P7918]|uniref:DUF2798 domain-containing protein n=1 Tax=Agathobaculum sp. Marseille-P7918 TaxID=2479843 RepID=UPI000F63DA2C|nr:DUF2798 domain-containing protein [Agathobaculum sp. Marseille-P7918]